MIEETKAAVDEKALLKNMKTNKVFKTVNSKLKTVGIGLDKLYIEGDELIVSIKNQGLHQGQIFINGFKEDDKHAQVKLVYPMQYAYWYENSESAKEYVKLLNKYTKVFKFLEDMDFSNAYRVWQKGVFMYEMEMLFGVKAGLKSFSEMVKDTNLPNFSTEIQTLKLSQTVPFIPDNEAIKKILPNNELPRGWVDEVSFFRKKLC